jgi:hypothetical protein
MKGRKWPVKQEQCNKFLLVLANTVILWFRVHSGVLNSARTSQETLHLHNKYQPVNVWWNIRLS